MQEAIRLGLTAEECRQRIAARDDAPVQIEVRRDTARRLEELRQTLGVSLEVLVDQLSRATPAHLVEIEANAAARSDR